jgi:hypothetical protein
MAHLVNKTEPKPTGEAAHFCPICGVDFREFEPRVMMLKTYVHEHRTKEYLFKLCEVINEEPNSHAITY